MKAWKAVGLDYGSLLSYDDKADILVCLTQRQVAVLKALLITAYWTTRWRNLSISSDELEEQVSDIDYRLDGNNCEGIQMDYRDNPADVCEVQYSKDGGETWLTMFRKDVCLPASTTTDIENVYTDIDNIEINNTTWDNDIINIAPKWEYVDEYSDRALCWAISFYVDMICDVAISQIKTGNVQRRSENDWIYDWGAIVAGAIIAGIASGATAPITMPVMAVSAFTWTVTKIMDNALDDLITEPWAAFEDEEAKQVIKCAMYQAQAGETPQYPPWRDSLSYHTSYGGNEAKIASQVHIYNQDVDVYINYMLMMSELNDIKETLPECPCPDRWEHFWDFANVGRENWRVGGDYGVFEEGVGFVAEERLIEGVTTNIIEYLMLGEETFELIPRCDGFEYHRIGVRGAWDTNATSYWLQIKPPPPDEAQDFKQNSGWFLTGTVSWRDNFALRDYWWARINHMMSCWTYGDDYGSLIITGITLHGVGVDPFSGRDTG